MSAMNAVVFDRHGPPDVLYVTTVPIPVHGADRLLVRVRAVTVNGGELIARAGALPRWLLRGPFPRQIGLDFVGEVAEVGDAVSGYSVGDRVWGLLDERPDENGQMLRSLAEYVAVRPEQLSLAPRDLSPVEAATVLVGLVALIALRRKAGLRPGERLLVRGASGGVGSTATQVGKMLGAHVTGLAGAKNLDFVAGLGAEAVYDYRTTRPEQLGRFDVVLDIAGTELARYRRLLAAGGRMVAVRFDTDRPVRSLTGIGASAIHGRRRIRFFRGSPEHDLLAELAQLADDGMLHPSVDQVYPLAQAAEAHRRLEAGGVRGKVVITID